MSVSVGVFPARLMGRISSELVNTYSHKVTDQAETRRESHMVLSRLLMTKSPWYLLSHLLSELCFYICHTWHKQAPNSCLKVKSHPVDGWKNNNGLCAHTLCVKAVEMPKLNFLSALLKCISRQALAFLFAAPFFF